MNLSDVNKDGEITIEELHSAIPFRYSSWIEDSIDRIIEDVDTNDDSVLSAEGGCQNEKYATIPSDKHCVILIHLFVIFVYLLFYSLFMNIWLIQPLSAGLNTRPFTGWWHIFPRAIVSPRSFFEGAMFMISAICAIYRSNNLCIHVFKQVRPFFHLYKSLIICFRANNLYKPSSICVHCSSSIPHLAT